MPQVPSIRSEFIAGILAPMSGSHVRPAVMAAIIALPLFFVGGTPTIASGMLRMPPPGWRSARPTRATLLHVVLDMPARWGLQALRG